MTFTTISFPAEGGPENGRSIEGKGMLCEGGGVAWPSGMWTPSGHFYELLTDENGHPTHWRHDDSKRRAAESA